MGIINLEYDRRFYSFSWGCNKSRAASTKWTSLMTCKTGFDRHGCWKSVSWLRVYHVTKHRPASGRWFWRESSFFRKWQTFVSFFVSLDLQGKAHMRWTLTVSRYVRFTRCTSIPISRNSWPMWRQPSPSCRRVEKAWWDRRSKPVGRPDAQVNTGQRPLRVTGVYKARFCSLHEMFVLSWFLTFFGLSESQEDGSKA